MMKLDNFAGDLHRRGELNKVEAMEELANNIERDTNNGLSGAFLTQGVHGKYDVVSMIANSKEFEHKEGYVFYDNKNGKAIFVSDKEI